MTNFSEKANDNPEFYNYFYQWMFDSYYDAP